MTESLEAQVGRLLSARGLTIALAESCTGGLIAHRLTNIAGSSEYLKGGVVSYANEAKEQLLGVSHETMLNYGAVSQPIALEMARGARKLFASDLALSVTGIAGPGGATETKPVGLTYIGLVTDGYETVEQFIWNKDRVGNKNESAEAALRMILRFLGGEMTEGGRQKAENREEMATSVEADFLPDGTVRPRSFTWQEQKRHVADIGRQWIEGQQRHVLVITDRRETFELMVSMPAMQWTVKPIGNRTAQV